MLNKKAYSTMDLCARRNVRMGIKMSNRYPCVKQMDSSDCGPACIATVLKYYGFRSSISKIRILAGTNKEGTNAYGIVEALHKIGFCARAVRDRNRKIESAGGYPCIAHVIKKASLQHFVVIYGETAKQVLLADPAQGIRKIDKEKFYTANEEMYYSGVRILIEEDKQFVPKADVSAASVLNRLSAIIRPQTKLMAGIVLCSLILVLMGIAVTFYYQVLLDEVIPNGRLHQLGAITLLVLSICIGKGLLTFVRKKMLLFLGYQFDYSFLLESYKHMIRLKMDFFDSRNAGEIVSRFNDASKVCEVISVTIIESMLDTIIIILGAVILCRLSPLMFIFTLLMVALYVIIVLAFQRKYSSSNNEVMEKNSIFTSYVIETLHGIETIKINNAEDNCMNKIDHKFRMLVSAFKKLGMTENLQSAWKLGVELCGEILLLALGAMQVMKGYMTIGELIVFHAMLAYFMEPIKHIIDLQPQVQGTLISMKRLFEINDLEVEKDDEKEEEKTALPMHFRTIAFQNVEFRYGKGRKILDDISFTIQGGKKIALVGESGTGKTTVAKLLMGEYEAEQGNILVDGVSIEKYTLDSIRNTIVYIPQNTFFFSESIAENLVADNRDVTEADVILACKTAQIHDFIESLPMKYNTVLSENGNNLSGGQKQRLAIARAILKKPKMMIMDESTSNLDAETEDLIRTQMQQHFPHITILFIAHRISSIKDFDSILVMEGGSIVEKGNHRKLMKNKGKYYQAAVRQCIYE